MNQKRVAPWAALTLTLGAIGGAVYGQSDSPGEIAGDWKGQLDVNATSFRLVLHISKTASGFTGSLDSLDQGAFGIPVDSIRRNDSHLRLELTGIGAQFDGEWDPDTRQFAGQWVQGPAQLPLSWKRAPTADPASDLPMSDGDRQYLLDYLKQTQDGVIRSIAHLTPAQWTFRPGPDRWSIAECVEHLVMEEQTLFRNVTETVVKIPLPAGQARADHKLDERIVQYLTDRSQKMSAVESLQPHGRLDTVEEGIAQFSKVRGASIEWVRTTKADLRGHGTANPLFNYLDAYGYWIVLAAHSARHTMQMEEVKGATGYPK